MSSLTQNISRLNDADLLSIREKQMNRLTDFYFRKHNDPFFLSGSGVFNTVETGCINEAWLERSIADLAAKADDIRDQKVFRPLGFEVWFYGVHFIDRLFGTSIVRSPETGVWWSGTLSNEIGNLCFPDLEVNNLWQEIGRLYSLVTGCGVKLPFISSQVLGSPMVGLFNLYKERLLYAFCDQPEAVKHDVAVYTDVLKYLHRWHQSVIPADQFQPIVIGGRCQPRGCGQMCGCSTQLISKEIYDEFFAQADREILSLYPYGGMYHLCGSHTQHISTWREMPELHAVQLNDRASDDFEHYFQGLRDDQLIYINPSSVMSIDKIMSLSHGKRTVMIDTVEHLLKYT